MASPPDEPVFRPALVLEALDRAGVRTIVVGAYAGRLRQMPIQTHDLDLTPDLARHNLDRLAAALHELRATVRVHNHEPGPVRLPPDGGLIAKAPILPLHVPGVGDVDIIHQAAGEAAPAGGPLTYHVLAGEATWEQVPESDVRALTMSEGHWVAAKRAAPVRDKDAAHLEVYRRWRAERG